MMKTLSIAAVLALSSVSAFAASASAPAPAPTPVNTAASALAPAPTPSAMPVIAAPIGGTEDWKGKPEVDRFRLGALTGLGIINATPGWALMGSASAKILDNGFIPDINNSVWVETELGPVFAKGSAGFQFSLHMRWNFVKDDEWIFYALGGIGGSDTSQTLGSKLEIYPRLGVGAIWRVFASFDVRMEVSHELIVVGPEFEF